MKRFLGFVLLLAAVLLLLCACKKDAPVAEITTTTENITTTEAITTTEEEITEPPYEFVPTSGENNGVRWRTLDWEDKSNSEIKEWLENWQAERYSKNQQEPSNEHPMGKTKTLRIETDPNGYSNAKFILRDNKSGKDEILLEGNGIDGEGVREPSLIEILDDRYFLYCWQGWEWRWGAAVYDIKERKEYPIEADYYARCGSSIYFTHHEAYEPLYGPLFLCKIDISKLPKSINLVNLLENIPAAKEAGDISASDITDDERYFVIAEETGLYMFDLQKKETLFSLPRADTGIWVDWERYLHDFVFRDEKTIYWHTPNYSETIKGRSLMVEIKLP